MTKTIASPAPVLLAMLLAGCGGGSEPNAPATSADQAIAMVEQAQRAQSPLKPLRPEPVSFADAEVPGRQIHLPRSIPRPRAGDGCGFYPAGGAPGPVLVAVPQFGLVRHGGEWETFAADSGSDRVSGDLPVKFSSGSHVLQLADREDGADRLAISDRYGREVYASEGELRCKA